MSWQTPPCTSNFYPRPPRGGRPVRISTTAPPIYFYPRPPRGGRQFEDYKAEVSGKISTHALREEGDPTRPTAPKPPRPFLPTPSARRATAWCAGRRGSGGISTHALREEGDPRRCNKVIGQVRISTHALREEGDRGTAIRASANTLFLPTPSARRATAKPSGASGGCRRISTHALREEGDLARHLDSLA